MMAPRCFMDIRYLFSYLPFTTSNEVIFPHPKTHMHSLRTELNDLHNKTAYCKCLEMKKSWGNAICRILQSLAFVSHWEKKKYQLEYCYSLLVIYSIYFSASRYISEGWATVLPLFSFCLWTDWIQFGFPLYCLMFTNLGIIFFCMMYSMCALHCIPVLDHFEEATWLIKYSASVK